MKMTNSLIITVSLILNVLANNYNPEQIGGQWHVLGIIKDVPEGAKLIESCVTLNFKKIFGHYYILEQKEIKHSKLESRETMVNVIGTVIQGYPPDTAGTQTRYTVLHGDSQRSLVVFVRSPKMYAVWSRTRDLTSKMYETFAQYAQNGWIIVPVVFTNCQ